MRPKNRERFDRLLEKILETLPGNVRALLDEVPLVVEDYPSRKMIELLGIEYRDDLCGLYDGIPLTERSVEQSGTLSDSIHIFREGIVAQSVDDQGHVDVDELRRQIRITILHEVGHHFGLEEDDLEALGYD